MRSLFIFIKEFGGRVSQDRMSDCLVTSVRDSNNSLVILVNRSVSSFVTYVGYSCQKGRCFSLLVTTRR